MADDSQRSILLVVGAHPRAEAADRPAAYRLRERIEQWLVDSRERLDGGEHTGLAPVVLTDLWYVNAVELHTRPAVCLGPPELNAATAWLAVRLPTALMVEERLRIHLDPELIELKVCLWGAGPNGTAAAADVFCERYLTEFLRAALV
jgi:hypothetical protein